MNLVLASSSPSRKFVFDMLGFKYDVIISQEKEFSDKIDFNDYVIEISKIKAESAKCQLKNKRNCLIISADSIVYLEDKKFEKPSSKKEALQNIMLLSGKKNTVLTGVTICDLYVNQEINFFDKTDVYFSKIRKEDALWYVKNDKNILCRSGYSLIGGKAGIFVDKIVGDYYNIMGMPVGKLCKKLNGLGYKLDDFR